MIDLTADEVGMMKKLMSKKGIKKIERITISCPYEDILIFTYGETTNGEGELLR